MDQHSPLITYDEIEFPESDTEMWCDTWPMPRMLVTGESTVEDGYGCPVRVVVEYDPELHRHGVNPVSVDAYLLPPEDGYYTEDDHTPVDLTTLPEGAALVDAGIAMFADTLAEQADIELKGLITVTTSAFDDPELTDTYRHIRWLFRAAAELRAGQPMTGTSAFGPLV